MSTSQESLDDLLDRLVAEYADALRAGAASGRQAWLQRVPPAARPGLERCLKMIDAGLAEPPSAALRLRPGQRLDHYELVREIGRGGMALVWLARDLELHRPVALKLLRPGLALERGHADRFRREALAIARLKHAHIVQIYGVGEASGFHYLAMEFVDGPSLATVLEALPPGRAWTAEDLARATGVPALAAGGRSYEQAVAGLLAPVADALACAHEQGLVHRDVKPSNVLIRRDGRAVVADFGLAKGAGDPALSLTGEALGTPYYMSPEQAYITAKVVDHRTDVYSLGVTLYETLSGRRPFAGASFLEVIEAIKSTVPPSLGAVVRGRSKDAVAVVRRAMQREPENRYATARELCTDLESLMHGHPTRARADEGGPLSRAWSQLRLLTSGQPYEYRSARTFLGLPLVHAYAGRALPGQPRRVARGWLALGDVALGGIALGQLSAGLIACGGASVGLLFSWGGLTAGLFAMGGIAVGGCVFSGLGAGWLAFSGVAFGYLAVGGVARGVYALGGVTRGRYEYSQRRHDPEVLEYLSDLVPDFIEGWWGRIGG